jgi:hypothetical protein
MGKTALANLIENDPLFNVNIINNGNDNVVNFACGDQYVGSDTANDTAEQSLETDNDDETTRVPKSTVHHDEEFRDVYRKFVDDRKWALPSGTTVEDTLYEAYFQGKLPDNVRKSIRCWTVLVGNQDMQDLFKPVDWAVILEEVKPLPPINDSILHFLAQFRKVYIPIYRSVYMELSIASMLIPSPGNDECPITKNPPGQSSRRSK